MLDCHDDTSQPRAAVCAFRPQPSRERIGRLTCKHPERCAVCDRSEIWIGYVLRQERRRRERTQLSIADRLGFGMSAVSLIERGHAYANFNRTLMVFHELGLEASTWLAAISALTALHGCLLNSNQTLEATIASLRPDGSPPSFECLPRVSEMSADRRDQGLGSSRFVPAHRRASPGAESSTNTYPG
jgi:transcriptional regulator with XRE-family HTH domain